MKPFRPIFGGLTAAIVVVILTVAIVACTLVLGIVPAAMEVLTHTEEHVSPGSSIGRSGCFKRLPVSFPTNPTARKDS